MCSEIDNKFESSFSTGSSSATSSNHLCSKGSLCRSQQDSGRIDCNFNRKYNRKFDNKFVSEYGMKFESKFDRELNSKFDRMSDSRSDGNCDSKSSNSRSTPISPEGTATRKLFGIAIRIVFVLVDEILQRLAGTCRDLKDSDPEELKLLPPSPACVSGPAEIMHSNAQMS